MRRTAVGGLADDGDRVGRRIPDWDHPYARVHRMTLVW